MARSRVDVTSETLSSTGLSRPGMSGDPVACLTRAGEVSGPARPDEVGGVPGQANRRVLS